MPQQKTVTMTLTTQTKNSGDECVDRDPSRLTKGRRDVDVVRLVNGNPNGSGQTITVDIVPSDSVKLLFDPRPAMHTKLDPGEFVDWSINAVISGSAGIKFRTRPDTCAGHDQDDIAIHC